MADETVECDSARHDVPARLLPRQIDRGEHFRLHKRKLVAVPRAAERSPTIVVAVSLQSTTSDGLNGLDTSERAFGVRRREDAGDRTRPTILPLWLLDRESNIEPR